MKATELCEKVQGLLSFWQNPALHMGEFVDQAEALMHCSSAGKCPCMEALFSNPPDHVMALLKNEMTPEEWALVERASRENEELRGWLNNPPPCDPRTWPD